MITIIVGSQWGDEGKGKITDFFAGTADYIVRFQGGNNAGHTVVVGEDVYKLHLIPSGVLYSDKISIIGNGTVVHPKTLIDELNKLKMRGLQFNLKISGRAHVIMPYHIFMDEAITGHQGKLAAGSTKRGIAPVCADKMYRHGIRMIDLTEPEMLKEKLEKSYKFNVDILKKVFDMEFDQNLEEVYRQHILYGKQLKEYVSETEAELADALKDGKNILFEGAQGMSLDIDHGIYPHTTSTNNVAGSATVGSGLGFLNHETRIIGIVKAYVSRVGVSPFPTELLDETGDKIRECGNEYGTTTGRPRRIGWLDLVQDKQSALTSGLTELALTKLDVLAGIDELKVCTAYEIDGELTTTMPSSLTKYRNAIPKYETLAGWDGMDSKQIDEYLEKGYKSLPENIKKYIEFIENYVECPINIVSIGPKRCQTIVRNNTNENVSTEDENKFTDDIIDFSELTEKQILEKLAEYKIALTVSEVLKIQNEILKRPPSVTECILWSIQGSEHSSYKSSKIHLKQLVTDGPNVILGPCEDAGIVDIAHDKKGHRYGIVMSHESHNHPSQIVPYEGAATGIGGNVRDVSCMGAKVIAVGDALRFGEIDKNKTKWIAEGVVSGIAGYGNPIGVPNIAGDLYFDKSYNDNCLVNVLTLGVLREDEIIRSRAPENSAGYDLILVGKPTDNSGFGGASFASLQMNEDEKEQNKGAVQEPNAFLKRHLLKSTYELFGILKEKNLLHKIGFKDLGAGGVACASVELADSAGLGAEVYLDDVPKGMDDLHPGVYLCSETQERFMWAVHPDITPLILEYYNEVFDLPAIAEGAKACIVGKIRSDDRYIVRYKGKKIVDAKANDVTEGLIYERPFKNPEHTFSEPELDMPENMNNTLLQILSHENIASRQPVFEQYDKQVQGNTVLEPGEADAGVIEPFKEETYPEEIRNVGVALTADHNPRYCKIDPYLGAINSVVEAMRNVSAVGAVPHAITDCLCFGNPENEHQMWEFTEGVRGVADACKNLHLKEYPDSPVPVISGNVSFYNESIKGGSVAPSPIIGCLGKIKNIEQTVSMDLKQPMSNIVMIGERLDECGGSVYYSLFGELGANVPKPDLNRVQNQIYALTDAIDEGLVLSAHDISDGGIAIALAQMCFGSEIGFAVQIPGDLRRDKKLFTETGGFVLEVTDENLPKLKQIFEKYEIDIHEIGRTTIEKKIRINKCIELNISEAKSAWTNGLREKL